MNEMQNALNLLKSDDPDVRELALDHIGTLKPPNALEIILPFLQDENDEVRGTAACNVGEIHDQRAVGHLIDMLGGEKSRKVRAEILRSLGEYHSSDIFQCLLKECERNDVHRSAKNEIARQLRNYDNPESIGVLQQFLVHEDDPYVRINAVDSLLYLNRASLQPFWERLSEDGHPYVRTIAHQALASL